MFFDGLLIVVAVVLSVNGWNRGLLRSWRGPIAMVLATVIVQRFYVDFATWIVSRLRISPESAVILGYLILWFSIESVLEIVISMVIKETMKNRPIFFDRVGGVAYGLAKTLIIIILPLMATCVDIKIPAAPADKSGLKFAGLTNAEQALLVPAFKTVARALMPLVGKYVVSEKPPSFAPSFDQVENQDTQQARDTKETKEEIQNLLK